MRHMRMLRSLRERCVLLALCLLIGAPLLASIGSRTQAFLTGTRAAAVGDGLPARYALYDDIIFRVAWQYSLDPLLIKAIILAESDFEHHSVSRRGAVGLMQLMPATARLLGVRDRTDPEQNIIAGCRFFRDMLRLFDYDVEKALAAYNAGPTRVKRYGRVPPFQETRDYIQKIQRNYDYFRTRLGSARTTHERYSA